MEPKFCNFCQEMIYSNRCPYCERPAKDFNFDPDHERFEPEVDDGLDRWGDGENMSVVALNFDDVFDGEFD